VAKRSIYLPRNSAVGAGVVSLQIDSDSLTALTAALAKLPESVRRQVAAKSIRRWGKSVVAVARSNVPVKTGRLRKDVVQRVRTYKQVVWSAVGGRVHTGGALSRRLGGQGLADRKGALGNDYLGAGWRLHFAERGFHPRGSPHFVRGRRFLSVAAKLGGFGLVGAVASDVNNALKMERLT